MSKPVVDVLEAVEVETQQSASITRYRARYRAIEPIGEKTPVRKLGQTVMVRQELDLSFGLPPFGDVLIGANPATVFQWLMMDCDKSAVAEFLKKNSLLAAIDEGFASRVDLVHAAAGIVAECTTIGKHVVQFHAGAKPVHRLIVDPAELLVDQFKPIIRGVEADTLRQVGDRLFEPLPECTRTREAPGQVVAKRRQYLRNPPAPDAGAGRLIFDLAPHGSCPAGSPKSGVFSGHLTTKD